MPNAYMISMPKEFDDMRNKIGNSMKGKNNPKTGKPYTSSDIYAIATAQWKKSHDGESPMGKEMEHLCFNSKLEVKEDEKDLYVKGFVATSHPDRAQLYDEATGVHFKGDIIPKSTLQKIADAINSKQNPNAGAVSFRHDYIHEGNMAKPLAGVNVGNAEVVPYGDGEFGVFTEVLVSKSNPDYKQVQYDVEHGICPGFSIEYETQDYTIMEKEGDLYRHLDNIDMLGFGFASRRLIANPNAAIVEKEYKEIKEEIANPSLKEKNGSESKPVIQIKQMEESKMTEVNVQQTKEAGVNTEASVKELVQAQLKELVAAQVKEAFDAKSLIETKQMGSVELKEIKEYREAVEKGNISFKHVANLVNKFPHLAQRAFEGKMMHKLGKCWETKMMAPVVHGCNIIDTYDVSYGKFGIKEVELKGALLAFNSPTNNEATYYQAPAELGDYYDPVIVSHLNDQTTLFGILPKEDFSNRQNVQFRILTGDPTAAGYLENDATWTSTNVTRVKCEQDYANYRSIIQVSGQMMQAAMAVNGVGDVFSQEIERATIALRKKINTELLSGVAGTNNGTSADAMLGLQHTLLTTGNLYGKARNTYTTLKGQNESASSADVTIDIIRKGVKNVLLKGAERKNLVIVTSFAQDWKLRGIFQKFQQTVPMSARIGFEGNLSIDGIPVFPDQNANAGDLFILDMSHNKIAVFYGPSLTEFGITDDSRKAFIKMYVQFYCTKPENNYLISSLATS